MLECPICKQQVPYTIHTREQAYEGCEKCHMMGKTFEDPIKNIYDPNNETHLLSNITGYMLRANFVSVGLDLDLNQTVLVDNIINKLRDKQYKNLWENIKEVIEYFREDIKPIERT